MDSLCLRESSKIGRSCRLKIRGMRASSWMEEAYEQNRPTAFSRIPEPAMLSGCPHRVQHRVERHYSDDRHGLPTPYGRGADRCETCLEVPLVKPPKLLAIPFILALILPCCLAFSIFTSTCQGLMAFVDDVLIFWEALVEWWVE